MAPPPPVFREEASSGAPWFLWVGVGVVVTAIFGKVGQAETELFLRPDDLAAPLITDFSPARIFTIMPLFCPLQVQEFMRSGKTPQQMMAEMAMKQMMGSMGGQNGAG